MLLTLHPSNFNKHFIMISDKAPNNIIKNSFFYRLNYSDPAYTMNGIYIYFELTGIKNEIIYNKVKCSFDKTKNSKIIENLIKIEKEIITSFNHRENKKPIYHIKQHLTNGYFKIYNDKSFKNKFVLKISGYWTNDYEYGVTYKFFSVNNLL